MKFEVKNRWTGKVQFTAEIDAEEGASLGLKIGLAVKWAMKNGANLIGADLSGAVLRGADLRHAALRHAVLRGADLSGAVLLDADWIPVIPNIHSAVYEAASKKDALNMDCWHEEGFCGTTHCRAGWVTHLAGDGGRVMDGIMGTSAAAALIYAKSGPSLERIPDFHASNEDALADMRRLAEAEIAD